MKQSERSRKSPTKKLKKRVSSVRVKTSDAGVELEMFSEKLFDVASLDDDEGGFARADLEGNLHNTICRLIDAALGKDEAASGRWAGELLACISKQIGRRDNELCRSNKRYKEMKAALGKARRDIIFPKAVASAAVQQCLRDIELARKKLMVVRALVSRQNPRRKNETETDHRIRIDAGWRELAVELGIPISLFQCIELPDLTLQSEGNWWTVIWSTIKADQEQLLPKLRESGKLRGEAKRFGGTRPRKLYLKDFYRQCKTHWRALVKVKIAGTS